MLARGFEPDFQPDVLRQLEDLQSHAPEVVPRGEVQDLRRLLWSSIDNDSSKDLDQIEVAERLPNGNIKVRVAIADVDAYVPRNSPIDRHAADMTTSVYAGASMFPMLPLELSTDATSLNEAADRFAIVTEMDVSAAGHVETSAVYRAVVRNQAQLAYNGVGAWLEGRGPAPSRVAASPDLQAQLRLQDEAAQALAAERHRCGALNLETIEVRAVMHGGEVVDVARQEKNNATELIEDFMIAVNGVIARLLDEAKLPSIRRVVRTPKRWDRIVALAGTYGTQLPAEPSALALNGFLLARKAADPDRFADVSLAVVKLMGRGEYVLERPGADPPGHFGLAVEDYTHSTAPNRRFADLVTQRLVKASLTKQASPYSEGDLDAIARNCTAKEDAANKVERDVAKCIAALAMGHRIGETFDAIVTGASPKGTFVRVLQPRVEGMLMHPRPGVDVGDRLRVTLVHTDPGRGFIDFTEARRSA
jgi:VacB/RNase II family 3'-5' exoribonuclease